MTAAKAEWIKETLADPFFSDENVLAGFVQSGIDAQTAAHYVSIRAAYLPTVEDEITTGTAFGGELIPELPLGSMPTVGSAIRAVFAGVKRESEAA